MLAVLVLLAATGVYRGVSESSGAPDGGVDLPPPSPGEEFSRFRTDAWFLPDDELLGFVRVPAGPFVMGSDPATDSLAFDNERWAHTGGSALVEIPEYFIGRFPVTVAQFRVFVEETDHRIDPGALQPPADHPVAFVSWPDAVAYARWLEEKLRGWPDTPPVIANVLDGGWRITLPTEAEWEKAARGTDGRIFPWGDEPRRDRANFLGRGTSPVGSFACPECPYGLADMSGNVWEWTRTPFQASPYELEPKLPELREDALWVMRGGSFGDPPQNIRAAVRGGGDPGARRPFIGFRLAITR